MVNKLVNYNKGIEKIYKLREEDGDDAVSKSRDSFF